MKMDKYVPILNATIPSNGGYSRCSARNTIRMYKHQQLVGKQIANQKAFIKLNMVNS